MPSQLVQALPLLDLIGRKTAGGVEKPGNSSVLRIGTMVLAIAGLALPLPALKLPM
jgi:hypothetical protein